jgi:nicotinate-nucleotide adenylyltransferase
MAALAESAASLPVSGPVPRRVGVFGGAFDPPHNAHVALVRAAMTQLRLDVLHVFPTGHAWHKRRPLSPAQHRLAMAQLAFGDCAGVRVDDRELQRTGPTYTIDTLTELQCEYKGAQLFLVLGGDQAVALKSWHRWQDILQIAIISVAVRVYSTPTPLAFDAQKLPSDIDGARFEPLQLPPMSLSATDIRARVADGLGIDHLVPAGVARYIDHHHLYLAP